MTTLNITTAIATVTDEQIDRCHRIYDLNKNEVFYQVESESDSLVEYEVRYNKERGYTCTCPAGQEGFCHCYKNGVCKHVVWSVAAAREFHDNEIKEQGDIATLQGSGVPLETAIAMAYNETPTQCEQFTVVVDLTLSSLDGMKWIERDGRMIPTGY